jgi:hypothetical protein
MPLARASGGGWFPVSFLMRRQWSEWVKKHSAQYRCHSSSTTGTSGPATEARREGAESLPYQAASQRSRPRR